MNRKNQQLQQPPPRSKSKFQFDFYKILLITVEPVGEEKISSSALPVEEKREALKEFIKSPQQNLLIHKEERKFRGAQIPVKLGDSSDSESLE